MAIQRRLSRVSGALAAFIFCLVLIVLILVLNFRNTYITPFGPLSSNAHSAYTAGTTVVAVLITAFITGQIRKLWVQKIAGSAGFDRVDSKWRIALGVGSLKDSKHGLWISSSYIIAGLVTTAVVTALTPTVSERLVDSYTAIISSGAPFPQPIDCATIWSPAQAPWNFSSFGWKLSNGSQLWVDASGGGCPTYWARELAGGINPLTPHQCAYTDKGVCVAPSAIGAPVSIYATPAEGVYNTHLGSLIRSTASNVVSTTQCVPVMTSNPVSCQAGGTLYLGSTYLSVLSVDGSCNITGALSLNPADGNTMAKYLCPYLDVGQATIVFGATGGYAGALGLAVGDKEEWILANETTYAGIYSLQYAITCTMDVRSAWGFRNVTLYPWNKADYTDGWILIAENDQECDHGSEYDTTEMDGLFAVAATSSWQLLIEGDGADGWWQTINDLTNPFVGPTPRSTFAFANSQNGLEDVLGVVAALVGAYMNNTAVTVPASAVITNMRVGSGKWYAIIFVLPPLGAAIILAVLVFQVVRGSVEMVVEELVVYRGKQHPAEELGVQEELGPLKSGWHYYNIRET